MNQMVKFDYRGFHDVPRMIIFNHGGQKILLDCKFDDSLDEYPATYKVYTLPQQVNEFEERSWELMPMKAVRCVGEIAVNRIVFDRSKRKTIDPSPINELLSTGRVPPG
jgi:hypothetical protein